MVVVEHLNEGLDPGPLGDLLFTHGGGHLAGIAVNACDQSVAVRSVCRTIINVLQRESREIDIRPTPGTTAAPAVHLQRNMGALSVKQAAETPPQTRFTLTMTALRPA